MLEVFTTGGGEYLVNTFNAVAAWSGGGGYRSLLRVVMVMGLIYSLCVVAFTLNWRAWFNWFLQSTLIYMCLMVPTISVKVTDRINPSLAPATVDNVPLGLGMLASFTSQVGDYLTRTAETVFVMPAELNYTSNGMVYGARLFDASRNFTIRDAEFATNLEGHFRNCVFGDIMLYRKSLTELANAQDLWAAIGPGSNARSQEFITRDAGGVTSHIITCRQAYDTLSGQWNQMIEANSNLWGLEVYPKLSSAAAAAKLKHDLPIVNQAFTGSGVGYAQAMRQNTAINAFMQARNSMAGGTGSAAIDTFAVTRADIQARNTYNSIAQQAMAWVPILNIVLTVVFFAMFPVIFPLFLLPQTGINTLKGYAMGFFYLAAWGPLYVILHMICMTRAEAASNAMASGGISLGSWAGIGAVNAETATIAGFMLMSVPFLAAGLARGAMSIAGQSMSMLAPAQNAAEAAAVEQTTGNYSYGNESWANLTSNMRQSNQWTTAASYMAGAASMGFRTDNGAVIHNYGNGEEVYDTTGALSRLQFTPSLTSSTHSELRELASAAHRAAVAREQSASDTLTATHTNRSAFGTSTERSTGWDSSSGTQSNTSIESFDRRTGSSAEGIDERSTISQNQRVSEGRDRQAQTQAQVSGSISAGIGGGGGRSGSGGRGGAGLLPGIAGSVTQSGSQLDSLGYRTDDSRGTESASVSSSGVRDEHSSGSGATMSDGTYERSGNFSRASTTSSSSVGVEDSLARAKAYSESARRLEELSEQLSRDASYAETHGMQLSENLSQDLAQWYRREQIANPGLDAPELWATALTPQQHAVRDEMVARWMNEKKAAIRAEIAAELDEPDLVSVAGPAVQSAADVRAAYQPHGLAPLPAGPGQGNPGDVAAMIEAGRAELDAAKGAAQAIRGQRVQGAADVQMEVNQDHNRGFFTDPKLRE
jgi:conjugal transfer mating pair stabilization protein TraG